MLRLGIAAVAACALAGCAGRAPAPVQVVQPTDRYMDCTAIMAEVGANNERVKQLASDKGLKTAQNVAVGVVGIVMPILWFGMDFQGTADTEITALQSRQQYLALMADQKRCSAEEAPPPPPVAVAPTKRRAKPAARPVAAGPVTAPAPAMPGT